MKVTTTRTLNPLPFQDLEPHRFEDLIRQLAYDFRGWKSLEATGRSGSDEGLDIRATELVVATDQGERDEDSENSPAERVVGERLWIFQCKREKTLAQKRVREVVAESLLSLATAPHGFVLAIACDISKKTRDAFREEMVSRGIAEFQIWARGELEDMLFQSKNDRLLFAYFGISLTARRPSISTSVRNTIAIKKQLSALLVEKDHRDGRLVLLRDPTDDRYPKQPKEGDAPGRWIACEAFHLQEPGELTVLCSEYLAAVTPDRQKWDALLSYDVAEHRRDEDLRHKNAWRPDGPESYGDSPEREFWNEYIAGSDKAYLKEYGFVSLDRLVAIDPLGDGYFPVPHIFVDFLPGTGPFTGETCDMLESVSGYDGRLQLHPDEVNHVQIFPLELPERNGAPPAGFDDTSSELADLSESVDDKLSKLLAELSATRESDAPPTSEQSRSDAAEEKLQPFRNWRKQTALPLLSTFVSRLRAAGHSARIVVRSVAADVARREAEESIELRVRLKVGLPTHYSPTYRPSGHIRVALSEWKGWQLDVQPSREESTNQYARSPVSRKIENMPPEQLEAEVISLLNRLKR